MKEFIFTVNELPEIPKDFQLPAYLTDEEGPIALVGDAEALRIKMLDPKADHFSKKDAYLYDGFFYIYWGSGNPDLVIEPGIYYNTEKKNYFLIKVDPKSEEHIQKYRADPDHIGRMNPTAIMRDLEENGEEIFKQRENNAKLFLPVINPDDDTLKRLMKEILIEKGIDIDQYRVRFVDKNALFNFKQVIKGDNKLSMMLFQRGCDAFNLRYTITVEEVDPKNVIGKPIVKPIVVSSEDTFAL